MRRESRLHWAAVCLAAGFGNVVCAETLSVPNDFSTIQRAIDAAEENDLVLVEPGRYTENLTLRNAVDVVGRETARTIIAPDDATLPTVTIADIIGLRFSNFTLTDSGTAVSVLRSASVDVTNVVFDRASEIGLAVDGSAVAAINNVFFENEIAISRGTVALEIVNNIFAGNGSGILTAGSAQQFQNLRSNCFFRNADSPSDSIGEAGAGSVFGDPRFVAPDSRDFHLREGSACIDIGRGLDSVDSTTADAGVDGGERADSFPLPVGQPTLRQVGSAAEGFGIEVTWAANQSYRVTNATNPGGYRVYYVRGAPPEAPADYNGDEAAAGPSPLDVGAVTEFTLEALDVAVTPPLAPRLIDAQGRNESVVLSWEAVSGADAYRIHYGIDDSGENSIDVEAETEHVVEPLVNGTAYVFAVSAVARPTYTVAVSVVDNTIARNESVLSPPASLAVGDEAESPLSGVLTATPGPLDVYPPLTDEDACFIATAAFGGRHAADVAILRAFRDRFLLTHAAGRWLVERYYASSPPAARWLERHAAWKPAVRMALKPIVIAALVALEGGALAWSVLGAAAAALALAVGRRRYVVRLASGRCVAPPAPAPARRPAALLARRVGARGPALMVFGGACVLALATSSTHAQGARPAAASGLPGRAPAATSPRWMYAITGGYTYPDLDDYATFYGDDRVTSYSISGGYRLRDWLEVGGRIGLRNDKGIGLTPEGAIVSDAVELTVAPAHVFADFIFEPRGRRWAAYAGIGVGGAWYRQEVDLQPDVDGRTDFGGLARAGWRWRFASTGSREAAARNDRTMFTRSFVLVEAEYYEADADGGIELGGAAYRVGVRFEFEL